MITDTITISNLKCSGCAHTIKTRLFGIEGVNNVTIDHDNDVVTVEHEDEVLRDALTDELYRLGYPEATEENGLLLKMKSYASCAIGRMSGA